LFFLFQSFVDAQLVMLGIIPVVQVCKATGVEGSAEARFKIKKPAQSTDFLNRV
jgi:hypothetical protein